MPCASLRDTSSATPAAATQTRAPSSSRWPCARARLRSGWGLWTGALAYMYDARKRPPEPPKFTLIISILNRNRHQSSDIGSERFTTAMAAVAFALRPALYGFDPGLFVDGLDQTHCPVSCTWVTRSPRKNTRAFSMTDGLGPRFAVSVKFRWLFGPVP